MEILSICRVLEILFMDVCWSYDMYTLVMYDLYPLRLLMNLINACCMIFVEDVASISWINVLFACFIALIEVGCYIGHYHVMEAEAKKDLNEDFEMAYVDYKAS